MKHKEKKRFLRKVQTQEEEFVWKLLRGNKTGLKWRRQVSIGQYVADFYCASKRIALELDGNQHLTISGKDYDSIRDELFGLNGIKIIRISNDQLNSDPTIVYQKINEVTN